MTESDRVTGDEEVPFQARWLARLSVRERGRYRRARALLGAGGGARSLIAGDLALAGRGVYEALLARSWAVRFDDPEEMVHLAETALEVARGFAVRRRGVRRVADLNARAWGELANAWRVADRLGPAQKAFGEAFALLQRGTGDPYLKARLFDLEASLLGTLGEHRLALRRLAYLAELYQELGEPHLAGRALVGQALYTFYGGQAEEAVKLNAEGLARLDRRRDPALFGLALVNHLLFLVDLGQYPQAKRTLFEHRRHLAGRDRATSLRLRWIEGRISYGLGELGSAEAAFREIKQGFLEAGQAFAAAVGCLDLAMVLVRRGRLEEAGRMVGLARAHLLALESCREFLGVVVYLEESLRRREATAELVGETVAFLWRRELQVGSRPLR
ncbi:MAG TPA: hypothetical protein VGG03_00720 [Thermoanaerobaculia bacterium]|jgi:tetratricopeptide (TPR) repeat protein